MGYSKSAAAKYAIDLVSTALQSGSIKLSGSSSAQEKAKEHATSDAAYLAKLLSDLSASVEKLGD